MPRGSCGVPCASTELPRLMAARSLPVGARSFTTSDGTVLTGLPFCSGVWASAANERANDAASAINAAQAALCIIVLPQHWPYARLNSWPCAQRFLRGPLSYREIRRRTTGRRGARVPTESLAGASRGGATLPDLRSEHGELFHL